MANRAGLGTDEGYPYTPPMKWYDWLLIIGFIAFVAFVVYVIWW